MVHHPFGERICIKKPIWSTRISHPKCSFFTEGKFTIACIAEYGLIKCRINTNMNKVSFWLVVHMLFTPGLAESIREENTAPAFHSGGLSGWKKLHLQLLPSIERPMARNLTNINKLHRDTKRPLKHHNRRQIASKGPQNPHLSPTTPTSTALNFGDNIDQIRPTLIGSFIKTPLAYITVQPFEPHSETDQLYARGRFLAKYMALSFVALASPSIIRCEYCWVAIYAQVSRERANRVLEFSAGERGRRFADYDWKRVEWYLIDWELCSSRSGYIGFFVVKLFYGELYLGSSLTHSYINSIIFFLCWIIFKKKGG